MDDALELLPVLVALAPVPVVVTVLPVSEDFNSVIDASDVAETPRTLRARSRRRKPI
jgi:hypothetical protein